MEPEEQAGSGHTSTQTELTAFAVLRRPLERSRFAHRPWTDVHALGLILTEILTDTQAYQAQDTTQIYAEIVGRAPTLWLRRRRRPAPGRPSRPRLSLAPPNATATRPTSSPPSRPLSTTPNAGGSRALRLSLALACRSTARLRPPRPSPTSLMGANR